MAWDGRQGRLERLLRPRSIAVVGGRWAEQVIEQCRRIGFEGSLNAVHPHRDSLAGLASVASVEQLPVVPDAVFVGVRRERAIEIVDSLRERNAGGVVCFAAGFAEAVAQDPAGPERQRALLAAAGDMPLVGPNCYGFLNYLDRTALWPDQHGGTRVARGVAILAQSSNIAINLTMQRRGLPIGYVLTAGNQADVSLVELGSTVLEDPRVTALGLHVEGFGDLRGLERLARRARSLGKCIVALVTGRTDVSRRALVSHSASLAGAAAASDACLARLDIVRVGSLESFVETLKLVHVHGRPRGRRLVSLSCSGGEAALIADSADGFDWPALDADRLASLRALLGPQVALANPLDYQTTLWHDPAALARVFATVIGSDERFDIAVLLLDMPRGDRCDVSDWRAVAEAFVTATGGWSGCRAVISTLPESMPEEFAAALGAVGVVPFSGLEAALEALRLATVVHRGDAFVPMWLPGREAATTPPHVHDEHAAKRWLSIQGVPVPVGRRVSPDERLDSALDAIGFDLQYPLVVKSLGLSHKSESGGVRLDILDRDALEAALQELATAAGCLVEAQHVGPSVELLVAVVRDPVHGMLMTLGAGGVEAELRQDTVHALLPLDESPWTLVSRLRSVSRFTGFRGRPGVDRSSLDSVVRAVEAAALALGDELVELELNPVLCGADSAVAVDALLSTRGSALPACTTSSVALSSVTSQASR